MEQKKAQPNKNIAKAALKSIALKKNELSHEQKLQVIAKARQMLNK